MDKCTNSIVEGAEIAENGEGFNTVFDDVFRTIAQKMSFLLIPLINEVFGTTYAEEQKFEKRLLALLPYRILRYEHFLKSNSENPKKIERMLDDYRLSCGKLQQMQEQGYYFPKQQSM